MNVVSPDALILVRMGLRQADDPRMLNTIKVVDGELRREMTTGSGWLRTRMMATASTTMERRSIPMA